MGITLSQTVRCFYFNAFLIEGNLELDGESPASAARNVLFFFNAASANYLATSGGSFGS